MRLSGAFLPSAYNFAVPFGEETLVFSAFSGALISLQGADGRRVAAALTGEAGVDLTELPSDVVTELFDKGFLTISPSSQLDQVRERFQNARNVTPMVLTVTTTLDCNLGCYYCYQERSGEMLTSADAKNIVDDTRQKLLGSGRKRLHVDWYGGEPLGNSDFIEECSLALQDMCKSIGVSYRASIISNGTLWPEDVGSFVTRHAIHHVQISFDGMADRHDKIRRFRSKNDRELGLSAFHLASRLVGRLADFARVDARFNIDRENTADLQSFIEHARSEGWFEKPFPVVIQPARVSDYSERSSFLKSHKLSLAEFDEIRGELRASSGHGAKFAVEESEVPDGYPFPKATVCAALVRDSTVIGADGQIYRCGLQVSEPHRAVGTFRSATLAGHQTKRRVIPISVQPEVAATTQAEWWENFDPCDQPTCSKCSFLPICMGGCPKKHLEGDRQSLDEQGAYWRQNLARLLAHAFRPGSTSDYQISVAHQFRQSDTA